MMRYRRYAAVLLAGCVWSSVVCAQSLKINLYPEIAKAPDVAGALMPPVDELSPVLYEPAPVVKGFTMAVPQPGDAYFDPLSMVQEAPMPVIEPVPKVFDSAGVREVVDTPLVQDEPLSMRMSDLFEGGRMPPDDQKKGGSAQHIDDRAHAPESSFSQPEEIIWSSPRVRVKKVIPDVPSAGGMVWNALAGANISQTLESWTYKEGAVLVWENQDAFAVLESLETRGSFETAVQSLLDQYKGNQVRPVGTLHIDPQNQQKTLIIRVFDQG